MGDDIFSREKLADASFSSFSATCSQTLVAATDTVPPGKTTPSLAAQALAAQTSAAGDADDAVEEVPRRLVPPASSNAPKCPSFFGAVTALISVGHPDAPPPSKSASPKTASRY